MRLNGRPVTGENGRPWRNAGRFINETMHRLAVRGLAASRLL